MLHRLKKIRSRALRLVLMTTAVLIILMAVIAGLAPFAAGYALREALLAAGNDHVSYENIDLNVFAGTLGVYGLYVGQGDHRVLETDTLEFNLDMLELLQGRLSSDALEIHGAYLRIDDADGLRVAGIELAGEPTAPAPAPRIPVFGTDRLLLTDSRVALHLGEAEPLTVTLDSLELRSFVFDADSPAAPVSLRAHVGEGTVTLDGQLRADAGRQRLEAALGIEALPLGRLVRLGGAPVEALEGTAHLDYDVTFDHGGGQGLSIGGTLDLRVAQVEFDAGDLALRAAELAWAGEQSLVAKGGEIEVSTQSRLSLTGPGMSLPRAEVSAGAVAWEGRLSGTLSQAGLAGEQEGRLTGETFEAVLESGTLSAEGLEADVRTQHAPAGPAIEAAVTLGALTYHDREADRRLLGLQSLRVQALDIDPAGRTLSIEQVVLGELDAILNILPSGEVRGVRSLVAALAPAPQAEGGTPAEGAGANAESPEAPWAFRLGGVGVDGASRFRFEDGSVKPPVTIVLRELEGSIGAIDSRQPAATTPVDFTARVDEYGQVSLKGQLVPLAARATADLRADIQSVDLARFSPYMARATGYAIRSGQLNAGIDLDLDRGRLDGEIDLRLRSPDFEPVNPDQVARFTERVSMPLELMVAALVDKQGDLALDVPISGDVSDPQFSGKDVFRLAATKAMQATTMNYLKQALQPYGALITVFSLAEKAAGYVALEPVLFEPGQTALDPVATDYLDKVAGLMRDRSGLRIKLCGVAVPADRKPLELPPEGEASPEAEARLKGLARERALTIKEYLVGQEGVKVDHLFICTPEVAADEDAVPRVMLEL